MVCNAPKITVKTACTCMGVKLRPLIVATHLPSLYNCCSVTNNCTSIAASTSPELVASAHAHVALHVLIKYEDCYRAT